jgi:hypothetical protein
MIWFILSVFIILCIPAFIDGYTGNYKHAKYYGVTIEKDETSEQDELNEINKQERIDIIDETLVKYNKLLDLLKEQYHEETNEQKKAAILKQQIITLEKLNKALEKREKLE